MGLETGTYINSLDSAWPLGTDAKSAGDDHLRLIKSTIKASFPNISGAMNKSHTELNNAALLGTEQTWTAQQVPMNGTLTDGATINWNADSNGQSVSVTLGGNRTLAAPTNVNEHACYILRVTQDATGTRTLTWNAAFKFAGGTDPTLSTAANAVDIFTFVGGSGNVMYCIGQAKGLA